MEVCLFLIPHLLFLHPPARLEVKRFVQRGKLNIDLCVELDTNNISISYHLFFVYLL